MSTRPLTKKSLLAWLAGAMEPPQALEVEEALAGDPTARAMLPELRRELARRPTSSLWRVPPPRAAPFALAWSTPEVFGGGLRPGDRFQLRIPERADASERALLILRRREDWNVVYPTRPGELTPLSALPREAGSHVLDLTAQDSGRQRWAVALPPLEPGPDWEKPEPFSDWIRAVALGLVPISSTEVEVQAG